MVPLSGRRSLPLGAKGRLYSTLVSNAILHASEFWSVNEEDVTRLEKNDERIVRWLCNVYWNLYRESLQ